MIIAIPINDNSDNTTICPSFGRSPYYFVFNTATKEKEYMVNSAAQSAGGAGIAAAQLLVDRGVNVVIAPRSGQNAADVLLGSGIEIYRSVGDNLNANIEAYQNGLLNKLSDIHPGLHGHGG